MLKFAFPTVCFALGGWQLWRLRWKEDLIAKLETSLAADPISVSSVADAPFHQKIVISNAKVPEDEVLIGPRGGCNLPNVTYASIVIRPMEVDGRRVLLNCGWLPTNCDRKLVSYPRELVLMREEGERSWLVPHVNVEALSQQLHTEPVLFRMLTEVNDGLIRTPPQVHLSNRHLEYTLTWFGIALATTAMSLLKR